MVERSSVHGPLWTIHIYSKFQFARDTYVAVCPALQTRFKGKKYGGGNRKSPYVHIGPARARDVE